MPFIPQLAFEATAHMDTFQSAVAFDTNISKKLHIIKCKNANKAQKDAI